MHDDPDALTHELVGQVLDKDDKGTLCSDVQMTEVGQSLAKVQTVAPLGQAFQADGG